jgi:hypothetical protein
MAGSDFTPHSDVKRGMCGASQSEVPEFKKVGDTLSVSGYGDFSLNFATQKVRLGGRRGAKARTAANSVIPILRKLRLKGTTPSWLDIGGNTGAIATFGVSQDSDVALTVVESDPECVAVLRLIKSLAHARDWKPLKSMQVREIRVDPSFSVDGQEFDVVSAFALIHWLYVYTAPFGSLDRIVDTFTRSCRHALIIEYVATNDSGLRNLGALHANKELERSEAYSEENLVTALQRRFKCVSGPFPTTSTRRLYIAETKLTS